MTPTPPNTPPPSRDRGDRLILGGGGAWTGARIANVALGVWLFISAFVWPHSLTSFTNTWLVGLIIAAIAVGATSTPAIRRINTAAAVWLFFSTLSFYHDTVTTVWNNAIVAVLVFVFSLIPWTTRPKSDLR